MKKTITVSHASAHLIDEKIGAVLKNLSTIIISFSSIKIIITLQCYTTNSLPLWDRFCCIDYTQNFVALRDGRRKKWPESTFGEGPNCLINKLSLSVIAGGPGPVIGGPMYLHYRDITWTMRPVIWQSADGQTGWPADRLRSLISANYKQFKTNVWRAERGKRWKNYI